MDEPHRIPPLDKRDKDVADAIRTGRCPLGQLKEGQAMTHCPLGFPGCGCADELMINPYLKDVMDEIEATFGEETK